MATTVQWRTPTIEDAERRLARGLHNLRCSQASLDLYAEHNVSVPIDLIERYQADCDALQSFADAWGFVLDIDYGDVDIRLTGRVTGSEGAHGVLLG